MSSRHKWVGSVCHTTNEIRSKRSTTRDNYHGSCEYPQRAASTGTIHTMCSSRHDRYSRTEFSHAIRASYPITRTSKAKRSIGVKHYRLLICISQLQGSVCLLQQVEQPAAWLHYGSAETTPLPAGKRKCAHLLEGECERDGISSIRHRCQPGS